MVRVLKLTFRLESHLLVGSIREGSIISPLRVTLPSGKIVYVIPSTTWKGVFRKTSLRILPHLDYGNSIANRVARIHHTEWSISDLSSEVISVLKRDKEIQSALKVSVNTEELDVGNRDHIEIALSTKCPLERLYGSQYRAANIIFLDTFIENAKLIQLPHVAIDRKTGKAKSGHLFYENAIQRGTLVNLYMIDHTLRNSPERKLLEETINIVKELGIHLGTGKSRGLGFLALNNVNLEEI